MRELKIFWLFHYLFSCLGDFKNTAAEYNDILFSIFDLEAFVSPT